MKGLGFYDFTGREANVECPKVGDLVDVTWDDCCVGGGFIARVSALRYVDGEPDMLDEVQFDNGVILRGPLSGYHVEAAE